MIEVTDLSKSIRTEEIETTEPSARLTSSTARLSPT
jgi:hypothetical protein